MPSMILRIAACVVGLALFVSNPFRDLWFYRSIAAHEGFGTTHDTYIIGFAAQLNATVILFPIAVILIGYGIGRSKRLAFRPQIDRFTWGWGIFSSLLAILMLLIEVDYVRYCVQHAHHLLTLAISLVYMAFIYFWWCCSLAHGQSRLAGRTCNSATTNPT